MEADENPEADSSRRSVRFADQVRVKSIKSRRNKTEDEDEEDELEGDDQAFVEWARQKLGQDDFDQMEQDELEDEEDEEDEEDDEEMLVLNGTGQEDDQEESASDDEQDDMPQGPDQEEDAIDRVRQDMDLFEDDSDVDAAAEGTLDCCA